MLDEHTFDHSLSGLGDLLRHIFRLQLIKELDRHQVGQRVGWYWYVIIVCVSNLDVKRLRQLARRNQPLALIVSDVW